MVVNVGAGAGGPRATMYRFKDITTVHEAKDLIDVVLSATNRRTPTVVHPQFKISRIRSFYMRKVKFCQQTYHDKLTQVLTEFPRLDDIHPFYADLCNVLYDRDHYKIALGQVNTVRSIVDRVAKDYVRLLKYADSPYKCKMLKRAALGRMCTAVKKLGDSLKYLEEVRKHLSRLPAIQPATRTLILAGFPNVGKSSFMNVVSHANVDVQPYAFTTKSLFVGHFDFNLLRWQVIDTPGILDHPLANRNTIELTAITALAHLNAAVLFFVDVSEECGWSIAAQVDLFHNIKVLFQKKPLVIVLNKVDVVRFNNIDPESQRLIKEMTQDLDDVVVLETSCMTREGVDEAKNRACTMLLSARVEQKLGSAKAAAVLPRLQTTVVENVRPPFIPESVLRRKAKAGDGAAGGGDGAGDDRSDGAIASSAGSGAAAADVDMTPAALLRKKELSRSLEEKSGGAGVFSYDMSGDWDLKNPEWRYDVIPEMFGGRNVFDFIDPEIDAKLAALEAEEAALLAGEGVPAEEAFRAVDPAEWNSVAAEMEQLLKRRRLAQEKHRLGLNLASRPAPRKIRKMTYEEMTQRLLALGYNLDDFTGGLKVKERRKPDTLSRPVEDAELFLTDSESEGEGGEDAEGMVDEGDFAAASAAASAAAAGAAALRKRTRQSDTLMEICASPRETLGKRLKVLRAARLPETGHNPFAVSVRKLHQMIADRRGKMSIHDAAKRRETQLRAWRQQVVRFRKEHRKGEGDHHIPALKPKHLFSGHRGIGKSDWR